MTRFPDVRSTIAAFAEYDPADIATVRWSSITVPRWLRRQFEATLNAARIQGAEVEVHAASGLLFTIYALRLRGTARQLLPALRGIARLED